MPVTLFVGTLLGFLTGLGIGGGSLLILWLTMVLGMEPLTARGINLLFFIPAALIACVFRWKQKQLNLVRIFPAIVTGCVAAALCAWWSESLDVELMKKAFGVILLAAGLRELFHKAK